MAEKITLEDLAESKEILDFFKKLEVELTKTLAIIGNVAQSSKDLNDELAKQGLSLSQVTAATNKVNNQKTKLTDAEKELLKIQQLQEKAINSAIGSYAQLDAQLKALKMQYKALSEQERNSASGKAILKQISDQDKALKDLDKTMGVHNRNVGNYQSALEGLPGPLGQAANSAKDLGTQFKALIKNPVALVIMLIVGALTALYKAFSSTDSGANAIAAKFEQLKAILDVVRQRVALMAEAILNIFKGNWKEAATQFKESFTGIGDQLTAATTAAKEYTYALDALSDSENNYISKKAENENKIARLEFDAQNRALSPGARLKALKEAIRISEEESKQAQIFAQEKLDIEVGYLADKNKLRDEDIISFVKMTDAEQENASEALKTLRNNYEEKFNEIEGLYANVIQADTKFFEENKRNASKISGFELEIAKEREATAKKLAEDKFIIEDKAANKGLDTIESIEVKKIAAIKSTYDLVAVLQQRQANRDIENQNKIEEATKKRQENEKIALETSIEGVNSLFDLQNSLRESQLTQLEYDRENKIKAAGQDKKAIERINNEYDAKERVIKRRQAQSDKNQAMFNASINIITAITKVLDRPFLVALVTAMGAVQLAAIAAKPIPKFATGVKGFTGGMAIAGDAGREMVKLPTGELFLTPDVATQMLLPKGTNIFTHNETEKALREGITVDKFGELLKEQRETRKALLSIEHRSTVIDERGLNEYRRRSNQTQHRIDKYFRGKS